MDCRATSDDERCSDGEYRRIVPAWISAEFSQFKQSLDRLELNARTARSLGRKPRGSEFRKRKIENAEYHRGLLVTPGLPTNCYNALWLQTLQPWEYVEVNPQPSISLAYDQDDLAFRPGFGYRRSSEQNSD